MLLVFFEAITQITVDGLLASRTPLLRWRRLHLCLLGDVQIIGNMLGALHLMPDVLTVVVVPKLFIDHNSLLELLEKHILSQVELLELKLLDCLQLTPPDIEVVLQSIRILGLEVHHKCFGDFVFQF